MVFSCLILTFLLSWEINFTSSVRTCVYFPALRIVRKEADSRVFPPLSEQALFLYTQENSAPGPAGPW